MLTLNPGARPRQESFPQQSDRTSVGGWHVLELFRWARCARNCQSLRLAMVPRGGICPRTASKVQANTVWTRRTCQLPLDMSGTKNLVQPNAMSTQIKNTINIGRDLNYCTTTKDSSKLRIIVLTFALLWLTTIWSWDLRVISQRNYKDLQMPEK